MSSSSIYDIRSTVAHKSHEQLDKLINNIKLLIATHWQTNLKQTLKYCSTDSVSGAGLHFSTSVVHANLYIALCSYDLLGEKVLKLGGEFTEKTKFECTWDHLS